jgi:hypothetical protein
MAALNNNACNCNNMKAFNTITGLWYVVGKGFVANCKWKGSTVDEVEVAVLRYTFLNVAVQSAYRVDCGCEICE